MPQTRARTPVAPSVQQTSTAASQPPAATSSARGTGRKGVRLCAPPSPPSALADWSSAEVAAAAAATLLSATPSFPSRLAASCVTHRTSALPAQPRRQLGCCCCRLLELTDVPAFISFCFGLTCRLCVTSASCLLVYLPRATAPICIPLDVRPCVYF